MALATTPPRPSSSAPSASSLARVLGVVFVGIAPLVCMVVFLQRGAGVWMPMLTLHWLGMGLAPLVFCAVFRQSSMRESLEAEAKAFRATWASHKCLCLTLLCAEAVAAALLTYARIRAYRFFFQREVGMDLHEAVRAALSLLGVKSATPCEWRSLVGAGFYFSLVNPLVEELFWRVFLRRELAECLSEGGGESRGEDARLPLLAATAASQQTPPEAARLAKPLSWMRATALALFYASYHTVVVARLFGGGLAALSLPLLTMLGHVLNLVRERPAMGGLCGALALHVGVDFAACLVAAESLGLF